MCVSRVQIHITSLCNPEIFKSLLSNGTKNVYSKFIKIYKHSLLPSDRFMHQLQFSHSSALSCEPWENDAPAPLCRAEKSEEGQVTESEGTR